MLIVINLWVGEVDFLSNSCSCVVCTCFSAYVAGTNLYVYGGWDGQKAHNVLHQLNLKTFAWSEVKVGNPDNAPPEMSGCGIVAYGDNKLVLFGGYGQKKEKKKKVKKVVKKKITTSDKDTTGEHKVETEVDKTENVSTDKDGDNLAVEHGSQEGAKNGVDQERVTNGTAESGATESGKELGQNGTESEETIKSKGGVEAGKDGIEGAVGGTANGADKGTEGEKKEERKKLPKKVSFKKQEVATQEEVTVEVHSDGDPAKEGHSQDDQNGDKKVQNGEGEENGAPKPVEEGESVKEEEEEEEERRRRRLVQTFYSTREMTPTRRGGQMKSKYLILALVSVCTQ